MGRVTADSKGDFYEAAQTEQEFIDEITVDQGKVHIVTAPTVRGSQMFAALIEFHWYPPSEPALNDQFEVRGRIWEDIPYNVISFPRGRYPDAQIIAVQPWLADCRWRADDALKRSSRPDLDAR